jgi:preprotein translocase subunit SecE
VTAPASAPAAGRLAGVRTFLQDVAAEMRKVTWPTRDEVRKATLAIIAFVGVLGLAIGLLDSVLQFVLVKLVARMFG